MALAHSPAGILPPVEHWTGINKKYKENIVGSISSQWYA